MVSPIRTMPQLRWSGLAKMGPYQEYPSEKKNRTLYLRRMRLGTIVAAALALASKLEATRIPRTFPLSSLAATLPM